MISILDLLLRLTIWFLLTSDLSLPNILIGIAVALLIPRRYTQLSTLKDWLQILWEVVVAIPQAYIEAVEIMVRPHTEEDIVTERVKPRRTPGLIFLDVFVITFTPKTIVLNHHEDGTYEVHRIRRPRRKTKAKAARRPWS
ncbi:MAG: cation:proton antiporter [Spirulina sp. SIO3F2]|nr:cation:proton antiporter [Spirulina sp. SIO3F2]